MPSIGCSVIANSGDIELQSVARRGILSVEAKADDQEVTAAVVLRLEHVRYPFEHVAHARQRRGCDELLRAAGTQQQPGALPVQPDLANTAAEVRLAA